jgi:aspartyl-tRNA(Asn)/glutamyl-tRNA(Gln) amidotransferase subunit A
VTPDGALRASAVEVGAAIRAGRLCPVDLAEAALARAERFDDARAFVTLDREGALRAARAARARQKRGDSRSPLDGVPLALKDNLVTRGLRTTCASRMLADWIPPYDGAAAEAVERAGAVSLGKTNLDELAMGSSGEHSAFGATANPRAPGFVCGGSSSGSAAAVALGLVFGALGSDTGGSIRLPAAFCGVWGLNPSYGRVSRFGLVAHASSLDRVGPLARTALDLAHLLDAIAGPDDRDATCLRAAPPRFADACSPGAMRVGVMRAADVEPAVGAAVEAVASQLGAAGHTIVGVDAPADDPLTIDAYYVLATAEAASNLARFDGMRFGHRVEAGGFAATVRASRGAGLGPEVQRRIRLGTWVSARERAATIHRRALQYRAAVVRAFAAAFERVDVLLGPVAATGPFPLGSRLDDPVAMYETDRWTCPRASPACPPSPSRWTASARSSSDAPEARRSSWPSAGSSRRARRRVFAPTP